MIEGFAALNLCLEDILGGSNAVKHCTMRQYEAQKRGRANHFDEANATVSLSSFR